MTKYLVLQTGENRASWSNTVMTTENGSTLGNGGGATSSANLSTWICKPEPG